MKTLYFDCYSGAAGDMIVGALLDLGVDFERLKAALQSLAVEGYSISASNVKKKGIMATQFNVELDPEVRQPHRHLRHVLEILDKGELPDAVKSASAETFRRIAESEAAVHGTTIEKVHFHEVGAIDSIMDVAGAHFCLHELGFAHIMASALHVGAGTVQCAHGLMPVPAPATALLLKGIPSYAGDVQGELVTPTGAALLGQIVAEFGPLPLMLPSGVGYGAGTKDLPGRANVLRVIMGESAAQDTSAECITIVETNLDDMNPELIAELVQGLMNAGARDAFITPIVGKKGRPAHMVTVLCEAAKAQEIAGILFRNSSTLGVRMREERRICLARAWKTAATPWGEVRVKIGEFHGERTVAAPEFEDCRRVAEVGGVSVKAVYESALAKALTGDLSEAPEQAR
ncbi:MAG: nickel pincer cofactor biosynthesis protein LarC [Candidatus Hydrogenedentes bacterium]|nr:nickel pincer cofactor biosynthesis protein LarC [Candidatus Hydrogenedentota bacterium]